MQFLGRSLVILAAALIVVGITVAVSRPGLATRGNADFQQRGEFVQPPGREAAAESAAVPGGRQAERAGPHSGAHGRHAGSAGLFGLGEVLKSLVVVGLIVAAVVQGPRLEHWLRRNRNVPPQRPPADPIESV